MFIGMGTVVLGSCPRGILRKQRRIRSFFAFGPAPGKAQRPRKGQEPAGDIFLPPRPVAQDRLPAHQFATA